MTITSDQNFLLNILYQASICIKVSVNLVSVKNLLILDYYSQLEIFKS